jgi:hypothetical protein
MRRSLKLESLGAGYDVLTLWLREHETIGARVAATPPQQLALTIITLEEVLGGWYTQIRQARDDQQRARAYQALHEAIEFSGSVLDLLFFLSTCGIDRPLRVQRHEWIVQLREVRYGL